MALYRTFFETWLNGKLVPMPYGTRVVVCLGVSSALGCLGGGIALLLIFVAFSLRVLGSEPCGFGWTLAPVGVVITSIAVRVIATWSDADYILDVIQTTLDATLMRAA